MIQVLHVSAECYPAAKTGGLADVVGSLPKYLCHAGIESATIIPKYGQKWIHQQQWKEVYTGAVRVDWRHVWFSIQQLPSDVLGFPLFVVDVPGLFDRPGIYQDPVSKNPYGDEVERYLVFQQAVLQWLLSFRFEHRPRVIHCHDHHTALIPFMVKHCPEYRALGGIPTIFTIHNGQYQGWFGWNQGHLLPFYDAWSGGLLDWKGVINPMASAIRCAWAVTTVSESYLWELHHDSLGLESLFRNEWFKQYGIINGIDAQVWNPAADPMIQAQFTGDLPNFKAQNKKALCEWFGLDPHRPLIGFISRLVKEKGADLLPDTIRRFIHNGEGANFLVLGTGDSWTQDQFREMAARYPGRFAAVIDYSEPLSHQIYAGSDFLVMPSRVEPCGLNQMYAMRYGTIPIVRSVGGLKDTVPDVGEPNQTGRGIRFDMFSIDDCYHAFHRASAMYFNNPDIIHMLRERIMAVDFSWENTIEKYIYIYQRTGAWLERQLPVSPPMDQEFSLEENLPLETTPSHLDSEADLLEDSTLNLPSDMFGDKLNSEVDLLEESPEDLTGDLLADELDSEVDLPENSPEDLPSEMIDDELNSEADLPEESPEDLPSEMLDEELNSEADLLEESPEDLPSEMLDEELNSEADLLEESPEDLPLEMIADELDSELELPENSPEDLPSEMLDEELNSEDDLLEESPEDLLLDMITDELDSEVELPENSPEDLPSEMLDEELNSESDLLEESPEDLPSEMLDEELNSEADLLEESPEDLPSEMLDEELNSEADLLEESPEDLPSEMIDDELDSEADLPEDSSEDLPSEMNGDELNSESDLFEESSEDLPSEMNGDELNSEADLLEESSEDLPSEMIDDELNSESDLLEESSEDLPSEMLDDELNSEVDLLEESPEDLPSEMIDDELNSESDLLEESSEDFPSEMIDDELDSEADLPDESPEDLLSEMNGNELDLEADIAEDSSTNLSSEMNDTQLDSEGNTLEDDPSDHPPEKSI